VTANRHRVREKTIGFHYYIMAERDTFADNDSVMQFAANTDKGIVKNQNIFSLYRVTPTI